MPKQSKTPLNPIDRLIPILSVPPDLSSVQDAAQWQSVREAAVWCGVSPLIAFAARSSLAGADKLWCDRVLTASWSSFNAGMHHLASVLELLAQAGIPVLSLKGPLLAQRYYHPPFLRRPSIDLDLGVREEHLEGACRVLVAHGYALRESIAEAKTSSHHVVLLRRGHPAIELHFKLSHGPRGIPMAQFFDRAVRFQPAGLRSVLILEPADELMHLALHVVHGRFSSFFHFYELWKCWNMAPLIVREEAIRRAVRNRFAASMSLIDVAFRARWGVPFLPAGLKLPTTWFLWRDMDKLYQSCENWRRPNRRFTLSTRLAGRWLDFQMADSPSEALRHSAFLMLVAWRQWKLGTWRTNGQGQFNLTSADGAATEGPPDPGKPA